MLKYKPQPGCDEAAETDQTIENLIFIDFQYSCWTSPSIDLHYFLNNSVQESLRHERFDELIAFYHGNLETVLKQLEYKKQIPTFDQFKQQYLDKNFYGKGWCSSMSLLRLEHFDILVILVHFASL